MTMRQIDPRAKVSRRDFLQAGAKAPAAATLIAGGVSLSPLDAWAQASALTPHVMATLTLMARDVYPHDQIGDAAYQKAVAHWDQDAAAAAATRTMIVNGVGALDAQANGRFGTDYIKVPAETDRVAILQAVEPEPFFRAVRADLVVSFYNQNELWPKFGYEGPSADLGGYIHRGFNDIDWLPSV
jgi:hypothetical protein